MSLSSLALRSVFSVTCTPSPYPPPNSHTGSLLRTNSIIPHSTLPVVSCPTGWNMKQCEDNFHSPGSVFKMRGMGHYPSEPEGCFQLLNVPIAIFSLLSSNFKWRKKGKRLSKLLLAMLPKGWKHGFSSWDVTFREFNQYIRNVHLGFWQKCFVCAPCSPLLCHKFLTDFYRLLLYTDLKLSWCFFSWLFSLRSTIISIPTV